MKKRYDIAARGLYTFIARDRLTLLIEMAIQHPWQARGKICDDLLGTCVIALIDYDSIPVWILYGDQAFETAS